MGPDQKPFLVSVATRMALNAGGPPISIRHRTDIGGTGPDQPAAPLLLAGVRRPSRGAGHREDRRKSLPRYGQRIEQDSGEEFHIGVERPVRLFPPQRLADIGLDVARERQVARYAAIGLPHVRSNAAVSSAVLEDVARPDASGMTLLRDAADAMRLTARGYHRVLRVARTLADLDGADKVGRVHLAEALSYRALADEIRRAA